MRNKFYIALWIYFVIFVPVGIVAIVGITIASLWKKKDIDKSEHRYMEHKADKNILNKDCDEIAKKSAVNYVLYLRVPKQILPSQEMDKSTSDNKGKLQDLKQEYDYIPITFINDEGNTEVVKNVSQYMLKNIVKKELLGKQQKALFNALFKCFNEYQQNNILRKGKREARFVYAKEGEDGKIFLNNNGLPETKEVINAQLNDSNRIGKITFIPTSNIQNTVNYSDYIREQDKTEIFIGNNGKTEDNIDYTDEYGVNGKNIIGTAVLKQQQQQQLPKQQQQQPQPKDLITSYDYIIESIDEQPNNVQYKTSDGRNVVVIAKYINNIPCGKGMLNFFDNKTGRYIQKNVIFSGQEVLDYDHKPLMICCTDLEKNEKYCFDLAHNKYTPIEDIEINGLNYYHDLDVYKDSIAFISLKEGEIELLDTKIDLTKKSPIEEKILQEIAEEEKKNNEAAKISNDKGKQKQK